MENKIKHSIGRHLPALRSANFRLYFFGQGTSLIGTWLANIAEQWLIYPTLTQNRSLLGVVSALNLLPIAVLVLFAGVVTDRVDKRKFTIILQSLFAVIYLILWLLLITKHIQIWHVMLAAFLGGIIFAFDMPTRNTMVLDVVDKEHYASALSLNAGIFHAARAIGPAIAGFLIVFVGIASAYFLNSLSFVAVIISVYLMKINFVPHESPTSFFHSLREGFAYIYNNKITAALLGIVFLASFFLWSTSTLLPVFAHDIFKTGEIGFGLLQSFSGIGAMVAAFGFYSIYQKIKNKFLLLFLPAFIAGVSLAGFSISPTFPLALFFQFTAGLAVGIVYSGVNTLLQVKAPDHLRGRIMAFYSFTLFVSMPLGALLESVIIRSWGVRTTVLGASLSFIIMLGIFLLIIGNRLSRALARQATPAA